MWWTIWWIFGVYLGGALIVLSVALFLDLRSEVLKDMAQGGDGSDARLDGDAVNDVVVLATVWPLGLGALAIIGLTQAAGWLLRVAAKATVTEQEIFAARANEAKRGGGE